MNEAMAETAQPRIRHPDARILIVDDEEVNVRLLKRLRASFLTLAFAVPIVLLAAGVATETPPLLVAAFAVQYLGLVIERWYFLAEAKHPQNLYYQAIA